MNEQDETAMRALLQADLRRLREAAPVPPEWQVQRSARMRASQRLERGLRTAGWVAVLLLTVGAIPLMNDPRNLPAFVAPLLLGVLACRRPDSE